MSDQTADKSLLDAADPADRQDPAPGARAEAQAEAKAGGAGKPGRSTYLRIRQQAKRAALLLKGLVAFAGTLVAIGFCILVAREVFRHTIDVEPIAGPKLMGENGYSPEVLSRRLRDALAGAEAQARTTMRGPEVSLNTDLPEITVPAVGISVDTIAAHVRSLFGVSWRPAVSGEFVIDDQKPQMVRVRLRLDRHAFFTSDAVPLQSPDPALQAGALAIFGQVEPYIAAAALYPARVPEAEQVIATIIDSTRPRNDENVIRAFNLRGLIYMDNRDYPLAEQAFRSAISFNARFAIGYINLGNALRAERNFELAESEYRAGMKLDPTDPVAYNDLGAVLSDQGETEKAMAAYRKAEDLDHTYALPHNNLANLLYGLGKNDDAVKEYQTASALDPSLASPHVGLAVILVDEHKTDNAVAEYRKAIELDNRAPVPATTPDVDVRQRPRFEERASEQAVWSGIAPRAIPHFGLGYILAGQRKTEEATAEFRKAIEIDPRDADAHYNLGLALADQHKAEEAIAEYRKAIEIDPRDAQAHNNLGNALADQHKTEEAIAEYRKAIEIDPRLAQAHNNLGNALADQHNAEEAIAEYRKAIEIDPRLAQAHNNLGSALADQHKAEEAIAEYRKAIEIDPRDAQAHYNLGNALADQHNAEEAIAEYRKAIEIDPRLAQAHNNLGHALADQHKTEEAIAEYRKAIEIAPRDAAAYYNLAIAIQRQITPAAKSNEVAKLLNEACLMLQRGSAQAPSDPDFPNQMHAIDARLRRPAHCSPTLAAHAAQE